MTWLRKRTYLFTSRPDDHSGKKYFPIICFFLCGAGVEICYELYSPRIQKIEVLKLEKRLDDNLMYLRDALPEYSTVDPEMKPVLFSPTGEVPVNKVRDSKCFLDENSMLKTPAY